MKKFIIISTLFLCHTIGFAQFVQLKYEGKNKKIKFALAEANRILANTAFYESVKNIEKFDFTTFSGDKIANEMKSINKVIKVEGYWNPFSKANAKTQDIVQVNTAKLNRSWKSIINTLVHETVHAVDWHTNNNFDYTHNGQSPDGQDKTAPWVIGQIAEDMVP
jgi:hypothetical protein